jgi:hypothetical protein
MEQFKDVIDQIEEGINFDKISKDVKLYLSFENEPFLDNEIIEKGQYVKDRWIDPNLYLYTNGKKADMIPEDHPFDEIIFSNYGDTAKKYYQITGKKIDNVVFKMCVDKMKNIPRVRVWDAWRENGVFPFSTRAGMVQGEHNQTYEKKENVSGCKWGRDEWLNIHSNGDMVLCCMDWKRETKYGNCFDKPILSVLKSGQYKNIIGKVNGHESDDMFICKRCEYSKE